MNQHSRVKPLARRLVDKPPLVQLGDPSGDLVQRLHQVPGHLLRRQALGAGLAVKLQDLQEDRPLEWLQFSVSTS